MAYLGSFAINDYVGIPADCHRFSTGAAYAPSALTYSIYEDAGTTGLDEDVDMTPASPFDSIVGHYWARRQLTAAAGFEAGKNYHVVVKATVDSVAAITTHTFQVQAKVNAVTTTAPTDMATATELAKVPKSDSNVVFNSTAVSGIQNGLATPTNITAGTITTVTNLTNAPTNGDLTATMKSSVTAAVPTAAAIGTDAASKVLVTPAQKIVTDANGYVTYANAAPPDSTAIQAAADAALVANHLDHLLKTAYDPASKPGAADALLNEIVGNDGGVSQFTANALELGPGGGSGLDAAETAAAVWDAVIADYADVGSTGAALAAAGGSGDPWSTALPGAYGTGTAGIIIGGLLGLSSGTGSVEVDHDYGSTDALRFTTSGGLGIDGATIRAYLKSDWDADLRGDAYVKGRAETDVNGRWLAPMWLDAATYTLAYSVSGNNTTTTKEVTVT